MNNKLIKKGYTIISITVMIVSPAQLIFIIKYGIANSILIGLLHNVIDEQKRTGSA